MYYYITGNSYLLSLWLWFIVVILGEQLGHDVGMKLGFDDGLAELGNDDGLAVSSHMFL